MKALGYSQVIGFVLRHLFGRQEEVLGIKPVLVAVAGGLRLTSLALWSRGLLGVLAVGLDLLGRDGLLAGRRVQVVASALIGAVCCVVGHDVCLSVYGGSLLPESVGGKLRRRSVFVVPQFRDGCQRAVPLAP